MGNKPVHQLQDYIDAIKGEGLWAKPGQVTSSYGNITTIAQRLNVARNTVYNAMKKWKKVDEAVAAERETMLDLAENKLASEVANGNITAIIFTLKTLGKDRGYVERQELAGPGGKELTIRIVEVPADDSD
ncbi:hypothetical protein GF380_03375 [Candidatus Uhrbacteria bacterium]|nr:hypothetical protein [Candidatus Uhrbacteria bacterium]